MSVSVTMPQLGESVTEGTVTRWLKKEGEHVEADEPLLEVSTDKVDTEIPSPSAGVLSSITVAEDETVEVGAELAVIAEEGEATGDSGGGQAEAQQAQPAPEPQQVQAAPEPEPAPEPQRPAAQQAPPPQAPSWPPPAPQQAAQQAPQHDGAGVGRRLARPATARTSRPSYASWRASTTSTWPPSRAPASAGASASRTSWRPRGPSRRPRRSRRLPPAPGGGSRAAGPGSSRPRPGPPRRPRPRLRPPPRRIRGTTEKMSRTRQSIARHMVESLQGVGPAHHGRRGRRHQDRAAA